VLFKHKNSVAKNTTTATAEKTTLTLMKGTIIQWTIVIPRQAAELLHVQVRYHGQQIIPFNRDESYNIADSKHPWEETIDIHDKPYELDFIAWNTDDRHTHEFIALINMMPYRKTSFWRRLVQ